MHWFNKHCPQREARQACPSSGILTVQWGALEGTRITTEMSVVKGKHINGTSAQLEGAVRVVKGKRPASQATHEEKRGMEELRRPSKQHV